MGRLFKVEFVTCVISGGGSGGGDGGRLGLHVEISSGALHLHVGTGNAALYLHVDGNSSSVWLHFNGGNFDLLGGPTGNTVRDRLLSFIYVKACKTHFSKVGFRPFCEGWT